MSQKSFSKNFSTLVLTTALSTAGYLAMASTALAVGPNELPSFDSVAAGAIAGGTPTTVGSDMTVNQTSERAVLDWDTFNIGQKASVTFDHVNFGNSGVTVNRIGDVNASTVAGQLNSNGNIVLLNPNGIAFTDTATVDVHGLVASTGKIDTTQFMNDGTIALSNIATKGSVINDGTITVADTGLAAMVAPTVENNGQILAGLGRVALASGDAVTVDLHGDGMIQFSSGAEIDGGQINMSGDITGKKVVLSAADAAATVASVINVDGVIRASNALVEDGVIVLSGSGDTQINVNKGAKIQANGSDNGGDITVKADQVSIAGRVETNGKAGDDGDVTVRTNALEITPSGRIISQDGNIYITRRDNGNISLGKDQSGLHISRAELKRLRTDDLIIGERSTAENSVQEIFVHRINLDHVDRSTISTMRHSGQDHITISGQNNFQDSDVSFIAEDHITVKENGRISEAHNVTLFANSNYGTLGNLTIEEGAQVFANNGTLSAKGRGITIAGELDTDNGLIDIISEHGIDVIGKGMIDGDATTDIAIETNNGGNLDLADSSEINGRDLSFDIEGKISQSSKSAVTVDSLTGKVGGAIDLDSTLNSIPEIKSLDSQALTLATRGTSVEVTGAVTTNGGDLDLDAGNNNVTVTSSGSLDARGPGLGDIDLAGAFMTLEDGSGLFGDNVDVSGGRFYGKNIAKVEIKRLIANLDEDMMILGHNNEIAELGNITTGNGVADNGGSVIRTQGDLLISGTTTTTGGHVNYMIENDLVIGSGAFIDTNGGNIRLAQGGTSKISDAESLRTSGTGTIYQHQSEGGSIQNLVDALDNTGSGLNTIQVGNGDWTETVTVDHDNVNLEGVRRNVDARGRTGTYETRMDGRVIVDADNATVNGFHFLSELTVNGNTRGVIRVNDGADDATIINNRIVTDRNNTSYQTNQPNEIWVQGDDATVQFNSVIRTSDALKSANNGNGSSNGNAMIRFQGVENGLIGHNFVSGGPVTISGGSGDLIISDNEVTNSESTGIQAWNHTGTISYMSNTISDSVNGIASINNAMVTIDGNTITGFTDTGIGIYGPDHGGAVITDNEISGKMAMSKKAPVLLTPSLAIIDLEDEGEYESAPQIKVPFLMPFDPIEGTVGIRLAGGDVDLTGDANNIRNVETGIIGDASNGTPTLVDDTFGTTEFENITGNFIELINGAFFEDSTPIVLDAENVNFDGFVAADEAPLTQEQYDDIEDRLIDVDDLSARGQIFAGDAPTPPEVDEPEAPVVQTVAAPQGLEFFDILPEQAPDATTPVASTDGEIVILGDGDTAGLDAITTFAGGTEEEEAEFLDQISTQAGGDSGISNVACWDMALNNGSVRINVSDNPTQRVADEQNCDASLASSAN